MTGLIDSSIRVLGFNVLKKARRLATTSTVAKKTREFRNALSSGVTHAIGYRLDELLKNLHTTTRELDKSVRDLRLELDSFQGDQIGAPTYFPIAIRDTIEQNVTKNKHLNGYHKALAVARLTGQDHEPIDPSKILKIEKRYPGKIMIRTSDQIFLPSGDVIRKSYCYSEPYSKKEVFAIVEKFLGNDPRACENVKRFIRERIAKNGIPKNSIKNITILECGNRAEIRAGDGSSSFYIGAAREVPATGKAA